MILRSVPPLLALCLCCFPTPVAGQVGGTDRGPVYDCGTLSLYVLLHTEGLPTDLRRLESMLPAPGARGYSMRELQLAARARGLSLSGVLLKTDASAIDRPMILYLRQGRHGHFIVVRPVGKMGSLVQIVDPNRPASVADKSALFMSPGWTGLALRPDRPGWIRRGGWVVGAMAATIGVGGWHSLRRRKEAAFADGRQEGTA
jgi:Peptidase C39 family